MTLDRNMIKRKHAEALLAVAIEILDEVGDKLAATHAVHALDILTGSQPVNHAEAV